MGMTGKYSKVMTHTRCMGMTGKYSKVMTHTKCIIYIETLINSVTERRDRAMLLMFYKVVNNLVPDYLFQLLPSVNRNMLKYNLRNNDEIKLPFVLLETFQRSFIPYASKLWNLLSVQDRILSVV